MSNPHLPCVKTPKGIEEVERKVHGLSLKARQVLIMIDGKRDLAALQGIFPPDMVPAILDELMDGGFVRKLERPPAPPKPPVAAVVPEEDAFTLGQTFMINIARSILGIAADPVVAKLKLATDTDGLLALYPEWRKALKQSPDGVARMKELEKKLAKVLGDLPDPNAPPPAKAAPAVPPRNDEERFVLARNFMANTTTRFLGAAGDGFLARLETAESIAGLRALYFEWKESLRQSPDALLRLAEFESKLAALLS